MKLKALEIMEWINNYLSTLDSTHCQPTISHWQDEPITCYMNLHNQITLLLSVYAVYMLR